jgi:hypothetical protein
MITSHECRRTAGATRAISIGDGEGPVWSPDGRAIWYRVGNKMMAVALGPEAPLKEKKRAAWYGPS